MKTSKLYLNFQTETENYSLKLDPRVTSYDADSLISEATNEAIDYEDRRTATPKYEVVQIDWTRFINAGRAENVTLRRKMNPLEVAKRF